MAYTVDYRMEFNDCHDITHTVDFEQESGTGSATALIASIPKPLVFFYGGQGADPLDPIKPTSLEAQVVVKTTGLFSAMAGAGPRQWRMIWKYGGTEVWRGWILADALEAPLDGTGVMRIRAIDGLLQLTDIDWSPSVTGRRTLAVMMTEALLDTGHSLSTTMFADWHAADPQTSTPTKSDAVSGNTFDRYGAHTLRFTDSINYGPIDYSAAGFVLSQCAGAFLCNVTMADGYWHVHQREEVPGAFDADIFNTSGTDTGSNYSVAVRALDGGSAIADTIYGGMVSTTPAYSEVFTKFVADSLGNVLFADYGFETWTTDNNPTYWDVIDEAATGGNRVIKTVVGTYQAFNNLGQTWREVNDWGCRIYAISNSGSAYNAVDKATAGVKQDAYIPVPPGADLLIEWSAFLKVSSALTGDEKSSPRPCFWSLWLDGDSGTDYYWNGATWTSGTLPTHTTPAPTAAKIQYNLKWIKNELQPISNTIYNIPDSGLLRIVFYNVVETYPSGKVTAVVIDNLKASVQGDSDWDAGTLTFRASDSSEGYRGRYDVGSFVIGSGPTDYHAGCAITYNQTAGEGLWLGTAEFAYDWKDGAYSAAEDLSGVTLENLRAQRALQQFRSPRRRYNIQFRLDAAYKNSPYWHIQPISYDSLVCLCNRLEWDVEQAIYKGEWIEGTITAPTFITFADKFATKEKLNLPALEYVEERWNTPDKLNDPTLFPRLVNRDNNTLIRDYGLGSSVSGDNTFDFVSIGDSPEQTELLALRREGADAAIRFQTSTGAAADSVWLVGIDQSDSNNFKIAEALTLGATPTSGTGTRFRMDGSGNFYFNDDFVVPTSTYEFVLDTYTDDVAGKARLILESGTTTGAGAYASGLMQFRSHYWTGAADAQVEVDMFCLANASNPSSDSYWRIDIDGTSMLFYASGELAFDNGGAGNGGWRLPNDAPNTVGEGILYSGGVGSHAEWSAAPACTWDFQDGIQFTGGSPTATSGKLSLYADTEELPKTYIGTAGPVGVPVTWLTQYTPVTVASASATTLIGAGIKGTKTLPASHLVQGSTFHGMAAGTYDDVTELSSITFTIQLGGATLDAASVSVGGSFSDYWWHLEWDAVVASVSGSTANVRLQGVLHIQTASSTYATIPFATASTVAVSSITSTRDWNVLATLTGWSELASLECSNLTIKQLF